MSQTYHKEAFERIPAARKERILEIGVEEFATKGYENANINVIAQKTGISIGLMYKYFSTKEDLFLTCVQHGMEMLEGILREIMSSDEKLLKKAENLIRATQAYSKENQNYTRLYNNIMRESNPVHTDLLARQMEGISSRIYTTLITEAQENGDIRPDCDPKLFAFFLDNLLTSLQFSYTCGYFQERFKIYAGGSILEEDERVVAQLLKFIESAFTFSKEDKQ
ncbi:MAG: TetR/AcrR family transcriptional regulator [Clostridiales bacterium]|nr:TetR/AcrR family transcriptional regulator [Clostridiales bacterium]